MSIGRTKISYLGRLWHATTGCSRGCDQCWARDLVRNRLAGTMKGLPCGPAPIPEEAWESGCDPFAPTFHGDRLADMMQTTRPHVIGVSFLGDWCDPGIRDTERYVILNEAMDNEHRPQPHTLVFLTKNADMLVRTLNGWVAPWNNSYNPDTDLSQSWFGVSMTNAGDWDRAAKLCQLPVAHRWVSYEPAQGLVDLTGLLGPGKIELVIMGGLHGRNARWSDNWARSMRDQCEAAGATFYLKQGAGRNPPKLPMLDGVQYKTLPWSNLLPEDRR